MWSCPPPIKLKVDNILVYSHRAGFLKKTKKVRKWWQCEVVMHPAALICPVILDCKGTEENIKGLMPDSRLLLDKDLCPIVFIPNTRLETGLLRVWRFYTLIDVRNHNSLLRKKHLWPSLVWEPVEGVLLLFHYWSDQARVVGRSHDNTLAREFGVKILQNWDVTFIQVKSWRKLRGLPRYLENYGSNKKTPGEWIIW